MKRFKVNKKKMYNCIECNHRECSTSMFYKVKELSDIDVVRFKKKPEQVKY